MKAPSPESHLGWVECTAPYRHAHCVGRVSPSNGRLTMFRKLCIAAAVAATLGSTAFAQVATSPGRDATDERPLPGAGAMTGTGRAADRPIESTGAGTGSQTAGQTGGTSAAGGSLSAG